MHNSEHVYYHTYVHTPIKHANYWTKEVAEWVRALASKPDDLTLILGTFMNERSNIHILASDFKYILDICTHHEHKLN